jgi:hypothetical protein
VTVVGFTHSFVLIQCSTTTVFQQIVQYDIQVGKRDPSQKPSEAPMITCGKLESIIHQFGVNK